MQTPNPKPESNIIVGIGLLHCLPYILHTPYTRLRYREGDVPWACDVALPALDSQGRAKVFSEEDGCLVLEQH